jgi:hypothetical protein
MFLIRRDARQSPTYAEQTLFRVHLTIRNVTDGVGRESRPFVRKSQKFVLGALSCCRMKPLQPKNRRRCVAASRMNPKLRRQLCQGLLPRKRRPRHSRLEFRAVLLPLYAHVARPLDRSAFSLSRCPKIRSRRRKPSCLAGDRGFESVSLQRGVCCEPAFRGRIPSADAECKIYSRTGVLTRAIWSVGSSWR